MKTGPKNISSVLLDVNVCIDVLTNRTLTGKEIRDLFRTLNSNKIKSYIPACSLDTIYYILRRMGIESSAAKNSLKKLIKFTGLAYLSDAAVRLAFDSDFRDFEDGLIDSVAVVNGIDAVITSNTKDFKKSALPVFHPNDFVSFFKD